MALARAESGEPDRCDRPEAIPREDGGALPGRAVEPEVLRETNPSRLRLTFHLLGHREHRERGILLRVGAGGAERPRRGVASSVHEHAMHAQQRRRIRNARKLGHRPASRRWKRPETLRVHGLDGAAVAVSRYEMKSRGVSDRETRWNPQGHYERGDFFRRRDEHEREGIEFPGQVFYPVVAADFEAERLELALPYCEETGNILGRVGAFLSHRIEARLRRLSHRAVSEDCAEDPGHDEDEGNRGGENVHEGPDGHTCAGGLAAEF